MFISYIIDYIFDGSMFYLDLETHDNVGETGNDNGWRMSRLRSPWSQSGISQNNQSLLN